MSNYLSPSEMTSLVAAIQTAENDSTGEIRIHIDSHTNDHNAQVAFEVFKSLCKDKTAEKNAVLFHVNFEQKYLTIIGDEGINRCVAPKFWEEMHDYITQQFGKGKFYEALKSSVLKTGIELKNHFPITGENVNELPNEITFS